MCVLSLSGNRFRKERKIVIIVKLYFALVALLKCSIQNYFHFSKSILMCRMFIWLLLFLLNGSRSNSRESMDNNFTYRKDCKCRRKKDGEMIRRWSACSIQSLVQLLILITSTTLVLGPEDPTKTICMAADFKRPFFFICFQIMRNCGCESPRFHDDTLLLPDSPV